MGHWIHLVGWQEMTSQSPDQMAGQMSVRLGHVTYWFELG